MHELHINKQPFVDRDVDRTLVSTPRMNLIDFLKLPKTKTGEY
jgi:hypothetical protein